MESELHAIDPDRLLVCGSCMSFTLPFKGLYDTDVAQQPHIYAPEEITLNALYPNVTIPDSLTLPIPIVSYMIKKMHLWR